MLGVLVSLRMPTETVPLNLIEVILAQGSKRYRGRPVSHGAFSTRQHADLPPNVEGNVVAHHSPVHHRLACVPRAVAVLCLVASSVPSHAQGQPADSGTLQAVTISERTASPVADVTGFGEVPLRELPVSATVIGREQIQQSGARRLADLSAFDSSVSDAYNAPGYWDFVSIRGFTLDNRFNFRREGLPVNAETSIPLDNKERVEILKGTSGIQAGTSAPGGLVNYVVKRPTQQPLREARVEVSSRANVLAAMDISQRFGVDDAFGLRINAARERLRPLVNHLDGERSLLAAAGEWRISRDSVLEAEFETSRKRQASQTGFSVWNGVGLPGPVDPNRNLNNQSWVNPTRFDALTGTLRFQQALGAQWSWMAQAGRQELKTNDYTAFPFGCSTEGVYDRFCSDGSFDYYDFRSENEKRVQDAVQLQLRGQVATGTVRHDLSTGVLRSRVRNRFQPNAYNWVGTGTWDGTAVVPADPTLTYPSTNRDERSLELSAQDAIRFTDRLTAWAGLRHTRLDRASIDTSGAEATSYAQGLTTPWAALSYKLAPTLLAYGSWGQGVESVIVPNRASDYVNGGQVLPSLKSRQVEAGLKGGTDKFGWQVAAFQIHRPMSNLASCVVGVPCLVEMDGEAVHRGLEANAGWSSGPWRLQGGLTWIDAQRQGSSTASLNGTRPVNVPALIARAQVGWKVAAVPGLELQGQLSHEGKRNVVSDGSLQLPAWTVVGVAAQYDTKLNNVPTTWTLAVDNLFDKRYWRESPMQFSHIYLYPGAARSIRLNLRAAL